MELSPDVAKALSHAVANELDHLEWSRNMLAQKAHLPLNTVKKLLECKSSIVGIAKEPGNQVYLFGEDAVYKIIKTLGYDCKTIDGFIKQQSNTKKPEKKKNGFAIDPEDSIDPKDFQVHLGNLMSIRGFSEEKAISHLGYSIRLEGAAATGNVGGLRRNLAKQALRGTLTSQEILKDMARETGYLSR